MAITMVRDMTRRWLRARVEGDVLIADVLAFQQDARPDSELRRWPLLVDARGCTTTMSDADVQRAVDAVRASKDEPRAHAAIVADDDRLYRCVLLYENCCHKLGVRTVRAFRLYEDAEQWLMILSATREYA
jgi:hypothetical protein